MEKINHRDTVNCNHQWIIFCSMCHSNSNKQKRPIINGLKVNSSSSNSSNSSSLCENRVYRYSHYSYSPPYPHPHHHSSLLLLLSSLSSPLTKPSSKVSIIFQLLLLILSIPWINCDSLNNNNNNNNNNNINETNNVIHHHLHHHLNQQNKHHLLNHHHHHSHNHQQQHHQPPPPPPFDYSLPFTRVINRRESTKQGCPNKCECIWRGGKYEVDCKGLTYSKIPKEIHSDTQVINFNGNRIKTLEPKIFQTYGLINLQKIYLSNCSLKRIPDDSFISLTNLVELDLSNNYLDHIPVGAFRETRSLRRLHLNLNAIKKIDSSAFVHLTSLQLLDLSNCAITSIQFDSFKGLEKLNYLLLNGNKLKELPGSILDSLVSLKQINLHENHWFCDCRIIDLRSGLIERSISITVPPICDKPIRLKGSSWQNLKPDEFACGPKITSLSKSAKFIEGRNGTITCRIQSTPMSNVSWFFESKLISRQIIKNNTYMSFGKQYISIRDTLMDNMQISKLTITETMEKDSGTYICYASNKAGNASSSIIIDVTQPEHLDGEELTSTDKDEQIGIILATILVFLLVILSVCFFFLRHKTSLFNSIFKTSHSEVTGGGGDKAESANNLDPSYQNCKPTLNNLININTDSDEQDRKRSFNQLTSKSSSTTSALGSKDTIVISQSKNGSLYTSDTLVKVFQPDQQQLSTIDNNLSPNNINNNNNKSPDDGSGFEKCLESYLMLSEDENSILLPSRTNTTTLVNQVDYNSMIQQQSTDQQQLTPLLSHHHHQQQQSPINWGQDVYDQSNLYSNRSLNRRYSDSSASLMVKQLNNNLIPVINSSRVTVHDDDSIELLTRSNNNNHLITTATETTTTTPTTTTKITSTIDRFRHRRLSEGIITNQVNGLWNRNHHLISATINIHPNEDYSNWSVGQHNPHHHHHQQQQQHALINSNNGPDYLGKVNLITSSEKDSLLRRNGFANFDYSTLQSHRRCSKSGLSSPHNNNPVNNSSSYLRALSLEDSTLSTSTFPVIHESAKEYESELKN